jgi:hypothetical protein
MHPGPRAWSHSNKAGARGAGRRRLRSICVDSARFYVANAAFIGRPRLTDAPGGTFDAPDNLRRLLFEALDNKGRPSKKGQTVDAIGLANRPEDRSPILKELEKHVPKVILVDRRGGTASAVHRRM